MRFVAIMTWVSEANIEEGVKQCAQHAEKSASANLNVLHGLKSIKLVQKLKHRALHLRVAAAAAARATDGVNFVL